jgi:hypothetical protein
LRLLAELLTERVEYKHLQNAHFMVFGVGNRLTRNEQVGGSSPLVGFLFPFVLQRSVNSRR